MDYVNITNGDRMSEILMGLKQNNRYQNSQEHKRVVDFPLRNNGLLKKTRLYNLPLDAAKNEMTVYSKRLRYVFQHVDLSEIKWSLSSFNSSKNTSCIKFYSIVFLVLNFTRLDLIA